MLAPLISCPARPPLPRVFGVKVRALPSMVTFQVGKPVTLQISSMGNVVRSGKYMTVLGPSIIVPKVYVHIYLINL